MDKRPSPLPLIFLLAAAFALLASTFYVNQKRAVRYRPLVIAKPTLKAVTVTGEVVDAWCYASQTMGPGQGEGHKACALACSYGGVTMGILEDGTKDLYVAAKSRGYHGCNEMLIPFVAQKVTATGWVGDLGGSRMMKIDSVKLVEPAK